MSPYQHQYQQQQHHFQQQYQQQPQMYNTASYSQQQQQPQYEQPQRPTMAYNTLQVPMMFGMSSIQGYNNNSTTHLKQTNSIDLGCEQNYFQSIDMVMTQDISNCNSNNNNHNHQPPSLISIRRDSGFAPSLDELSLGIMASNQQDQEDFKGVLHTFQTAALQSSMVSSEIINDNSSPSPFLSTPTSPSSSASTSSSPLTAIVNNTGADSVTPVVPPMIFGIDYSLASDQRQFLQQQTSMVAEAPTSQYTGFQSTVAAEVHSSPSSPCTSSPWSADFLMVHSQPQQAAFPVEKIQQQSQQQPTLMSPLQYHPRQCEIQRPRQRKPMLQIITNAAPEQVMMFSSLLSPMSAPWEPSCDNNSNLTVPSSGVTPMVASPSMSAANIVRADQYQPQQQQSQQQSNHPWGFVSSPLESSFSSGSSTPLFASPSSSYAHSDMTASCQSSRAASPSFAPSSLYDNFLANERRIKRMGSDSSSLIIRSRKSSTSSTSSMTTQRRASTLHESALIPPPPDTKNNDGCSTPAPSSSATPSSSSTGTHQCPKCAQLFAGPAVLVRHIESIHDKLLWNCVGCKSNLSRRDAVTRHINLSPMDSICRAVGTIGQIKTSNGAEVHYEISSYRAKPLDEVMSRMGKKISTTLRKEIDRSKVAAAMQQQRMHYQQYHQQQYHPYQHHYHYRAMMHHQQQEMSNIEVLQDQDDDEMPKRRRRPSLVVIDETLLGRNQKM
ncbi:hypothetical protein BGW39_000651 [Mortierella sp. 14UC]|nr:hypothetical protein BGW39_000651 [Mortierella sp. 14UC]